MCVNSLSKVVLDSAAAGIEPAITSRKSNTLTTTPPSLISGYAPDGYPNLDPPPCYVINNTLHTAVLPVTLAHMLESGRHESAGGRIRHLDHTLVGAVQNARSLYPHVVQVGEIQVALQTLSDRQHGDGVAEVEPTHAFTTVPADGDRSANGQPSGVLQRRRLAGPLNDRLEDFVAVEKLAAGRLLFAHCVWRHDAAGQQENADERHVAGVDGVHQWPVESVCASVRRLDVVGDNPVSSSAFRALRVDAAASANQADQNLMTLHLNTSNTAYNTSHIPRLQRRWYNTG